jgi:hypothetical protein
MKYLSDYIQEKQTALFEELGVFFAFNNEQLAEGVKKYGHLKPQGTKWSSMGAGMYLPSVNVDEFIKRHEKICVEGVKQDLEENGREGVLQRELGNYEIGYTGDWHDENFREGIKDYGFSEVEIEREFQKHLAEVYKGYLWVMRKYHPKESRRTFQQWLRMYQ